MAYIYGKPCRQKDGWHYWGKHIDKTPEIVGPFKTEAEAQEHADTHDHGKPSLRVLRKKQSTR